MRTLSAGHSHPPKGMERWRKGVGTHESMEDAESGHEQRGDDQGAPAAADGKAARRADPSQLQKEQRREAKPQAPMWKDRFSDRSEHRREPGWQ
ncbi:hypothetical protein [Aestuariivirga sp.]|uniref:hypothetical protein n=1 Tax=Aestuariivirga sp. TaxID=2650926 RepID=UPI00391CDDD5